MMTKCVAVSQKNKGTLMVAKSAIFFQGFELVFEGIVNLINSAPLFL